MAKLNFTKLPNIKLPKNKAYKPFDFGKFAKKPKFPKTPKITIIKRAIKKLK